jgi:hypothetical protein
MGKRDFFQQSGAELVITLKRRAIFSIQSKAIGVRAFSQ